MASAIDSDTGTGPVGDFNPLSSCLAPFGHKSVYHDPMNAIDRIPEMKAFYERFDGMQAKAMGTTMGGAGTAGYAMVPIYLDPRITDTTRKNTPLVEIVTRVINLGTTADFNTITAKGAAHTYAEDAAADEADDTTARTSVPIKYLWRIGRVTGQAMAAMPPYNLVGFMPSGSGLEGTPFSSQGAPNAKQLATITASRALRELEENLILNGNATTSAISGNPNGTEFNGITVTQSTTNKVDKNTTAMDFSDILNATQYAFDDGGRPNLAVASSAVMSDIYATIANTYNYRPTDINVGSLLPFGVPGALAVHSIVGPIPIIPSMYLSNTTGSKAIYFLDMNFIEMRVLQDMTYEDLAHTNDSQKFLLKIYEALVMKNTAFNSFIGEIE
jgi:hypothetical protein